MESPSLLTPQAACITTGERSSESPALKRKASQRIAASEGSLILETYLKKQQKQQQQQDAEEAATGAEGERPFGALAGRDVSALWLSPMHSVAC